MSETLKSKARITRKRQIAAPHKVRRPPSGRPGDKLQFERDGSEFRVKPLHAENLFEKYRGIGDPAFPSGRKAVIRIIRHLRGR